MSWVSRGCLLGAVVVFSCGGDDGKPVESCPDGSESCACYGNSTCDDGLSCEASICRANVGEAGAPGAPEGGWSSTAAGSGGAAGEGAASSGGAAGEGANGGVGASAGVGASGGADALGGAPLGGEGGVGGAETDAEDELVTAKLECGSRDVTGATVVSGVITQSTTWSGVVHVTANVSVRNEATLTIAPGTKVIVGAQANIELGAENSAPRLIARGTVAAPIRFCGENDQAGTWGGIKLRPTVQPDSVLQNVLVDGGGVGAEGALRLESTALVRGVQLQHITSRSLVAADFAAGSERVTIYSPKFQPVQFLTLRGATHFPDHSDVNAEPAGLTTLTIGIQDSNINESARLRDFGLPYLQTGEVTSRNSGSYKVTFDAGVVYRLPLGRTLWLNGQEVEALGTPERPIRIQNLCGEVACSSGGGRLSLGHAPVKLENVFFTGLGSTSDRGVTIDGSGVCSFQNVRVEQSGSNVVLELRAEIEPGSRGLVVNGINQWLELGWTTLVTLPVDTVAPAQNRVNVASGEIGESATIKAFSFDVRLGWLSLMSGATLAVEPGARLRFTDDSKLRVSAGATLRAVGTADKPILFSQVASSGEPWGGLSIEAGGSATLEHVVVEHGGGAAPVGGTGANIDAWVPISLKHSTIRNSRGVGIRRRATDVTDYTLTNTFSDNTYGDIDTL